MDQSINDIVNQRRILDGPKDRIKSSSFTKYPWAVEHFAKMRDNEWPPSNIDLTKDNPHLLNEGTQIAVKRALAFLTNLDGLAVENLTFNIVEHITDYTVQQCIYRQIYEEANHVDAYDKMIRQYYADPREIYFLHESDEILRKKNDFVLAQATAMRDGGYSPENFIYAVVSNICLELIYFHSGFSLFFILAKLHRKMLGACEMIQYIQRDEKSHGILFSDIFLTLFQENRNVFTPRVISNIRNIFETSTELEISWGQHIISEGVPGISNDTIKKHIRSLADTGLSRIGMDLMYKEKSPYPWIEEFSQVPNSTEKNFFENKPGAYSKRQLSFD